MRLLAITISAVILLGVVTMASAFEITWQSPWPTNVDLFDAQALDSATVWACGKRGAVIHTVDGGQNWQRVETGSVRRNFRLFFLDEWHGWIGADSGRVLRTSDGGQTWAWTDLPSPVTITWIQFGTALTGWARASELYRTVDGGVTWSTVPTVDFGVISFVPFDALNIAAFSRHTGVSSDFARSSDGGYTWSFQSLPPDDVVQYFEFADSLRGWASGYVQGSPTNSFFYRSFDGGWSWIPSSDSISSPDFINATEGMGYGPAFGSFAFTSDSGNTWQYQARPACDTAMCFAYGGSGHAWLAGYEGHLFATFDGAQTWLNQSPAPRATLDQVQFFDGAEGWCSGERGTLLHTLNGGQQWDVVDAQTTESFFGLKFLDPMHGILASYQGHIFATSDGGLNWQQAAAMNPGVFWDLDGIGSSAWAVGLFGTILKSSDFGMTWQVQRTGYDEALGPVCALSDSVIWVGGRNFDTDRNWLLRSMNGGETWDSVSTGYSITIMDFAFADAQHGWCCGHWDTGMILATTDGGASWNSLYDGDVESFRDILRYDDSTLVALTNTDSLAYSTDNGLTWQARGILSEPGLRKVTKVGDTDLCMFGYHGIILRVRPDFASGSVHEIAPLPLGFDLRVYPNPTNSAAMVRLDLPSPTRVDLKLYDLLGRQVMCLGPQVLPGGQSVVPLNLNAVPSGHYFLRAQSARSTQTSELVIIR